VVKLDDVEVCRHSAPLYTAARALIAAGANPDATQPAGFRCGADTVPTLRFNDLN
jgi:hypothetical protein